MINILSLYIEWFRLVFLFQITSASHVFASPAKENRWRAAKQNRPTYEINDRGDRRSLGQQHVCREIKNGLRWKTHVHGAVVQNMNI